MKYHYINTAIVRFIRLLVCILLLLLFNDSISAQISSRDSLFINDALWTTPLKVVNHPAGKDQIELKEYSDKRLIILDFWGSTCAPCIKGLQKLDSMEVDPRVIVIPVSSEKKSTVVATLIRHELKTFSVYDDSVLNKYFPHQFIPHQIWILGGKIISVTNGHDTDSSTISSVLNGKHVVSEQKKDLFFDNSQHLAKANYIDLNKHILSATTITDRINGLGGQRGFIQNDSLSILFYFNNNLPSVVSDLTNLPINKLIVSGAIAKNIYCLQTIKAGTNSRDTLKKMALQQLIASLPMKMNKQHKLTSVWVIKDMLPAKKIALKNVENPLSNLLDRLNYNTVWKPGLPIFINESSKKMVSHAPISVQELNTIKTDPSTLNKILRESGLQLVQEQREIEFLQIAEKGVDLEN